MGSKNTLGVPIIDFSKPDLIWGTPEWESVKSEVRRGIEEYGCFQAIFDKITPELQNELFASLKELFDLPMETKKLNTSNNPRHGYIGKIQSLQSCEIFGIEHPTEVQTVEAFASTLWPNGNYRFSKTMQSFAKEASALGAIIRRMILQSMDVENYLEEFINSTEYLLRVMKYEASETSEPTKGLTAHIDRNVMSILYQNEVDGLEVQTRDGEWISVTFPPNSFTVIIGESLNAWTNGRVRFPYISPGNDDKKSDKIQSRTLRSLQRRLSNKSPRRVGRRRTSSSISLLTSMSSRKNAWRKGFSNCLSRINLGFDTRMPPTFT